MRSQIATAWFGEVVTVCDHLRPSSKVPIWNLRPSTISKSQTFQVFADGGFQFGGLGEL